MNIKPFEKKRALFIGGTMFPILMVMQFLGYESIWATALLAGVLSGISVILFPDPDYRP